ncbi:hypothetical protein GA0074696_0530 [Micromonospora purpureochromogenes]|uniref:Uncharacterized protein n=1 Tax=Micromonospora purpureochromogenes TaxID=47872 RepID=A0A1C4UP94_9ACTN|nr:hypothetical protein [Micromonospora purpureochromogenes]SCE73516.1 hypothetical protein GA0074696_0530 [Micromonospora purpureochromogenes]
MARLGWGGSVATAVGVAAGVGAAQLGFAYGLGVIDWAPAEPAAAGAAWYASLAWATWIAAVSTIAGAVCAQRLEERGHDGAAPGGTLRRMTLAVAGAVGALITVLLVAVPARAATVPDTFSPQSLAAGYAAVGVLVGLLTAIWALHTRAVATNVIATVGWIWLLAVVSVADGVLAGRGLTTAQLGIWQISTDSAGFWLRDYVYWPGMLLAAGSALLIGALAARRTARMEEGRLGAAVSGAAGPLLVAVAYFVAVPRLAEVTPAQVSAHFVAPYAVLVGAAGSVLVAALAQRAERRTAARPAVVPRQRTGDLDDRGFDGDLASAGDPFDTPGPSGLTGDPGSGAATRPTVGTATKTATRPDGTALADPLGAEPAPADTRPDETGRPDDGSPTTGTGRTRPARRGRATPPARDSGAHPATSTDETAPDPTPETTDPSDAPPATAPRTRPSRRPR